MLLIGSYFYKRTPLDENTTVMEQQTLTQLLQLIRFLHSTYQETNLTSRILYKSCISYREVLETWFVEMEELQECMCKPFVDEPEDMVDDIVNAVEKARAARMSTTQIKNAQQMSTCNVTDVPSKLSQSSSGENQIRSSSNLRTGRRERKVDALNPYLNTYQKDFKYSGNQTVKTKGVSCKPPNNLSKTFQTTYQKDFDHNSHYGLISSKSNSNMVKNIDYSSNIEGNGLSSSKNVNDLLHGLCLKKFSNADERGDFIQKIIVDTSCYIHGRNKPHTSKKCMTLHEALNVIGVPSGLMNLLKAFHQYVVNDFNFVLKRTKIRSRESFLQKLNTSNQNTWPYTSSDPLIKLFTIYLHMLVQIISKGLSESTEILLQELEEKYNFLSASYKTFYCKATSLNKPLATKMEPYGLNPACNMSKWDLSRLGIWNNKCCTLFSGFKNSLYLSYKNEKDCMLIQKKVHEVQKLHFQMQILEILQCDVFPVLVNLHNNHVALPRLYKSCCTLSNITLLQVPILLRKAD